MSQYSLINLRFLRVVGKQNGAILSSFFHLNSDMKELVKLSLATCIVGCIAVLLPTAFAGAGFYCPKCSENQLQSLQQCNATNTENRCGDGPEGKCFAATIELMNGSFIGLKDCFRGDNCTSSTACANITIQVTQGGPDISFRRCEASCCETSSCKAYLPSSWPPSPTTSSMSQTPATKAKDEVPTAAGMSLKTVHYLPICLLAVIQITS